MSREGFAKVFFAAAIVLLISSIGFPYWKIHVIAPQYPKGLSITIFMNHLEGDVREIDGLNHYIGMKMLDKAAQIERRLAILGMMGIALSLLIAAGIRRRWSILFSLPAVFFPFFFAADLYLWLRHYGLNLDPHAALSSSIKPFVPPLLGQGGIGQFKAIASFEAGFYLSLIVVLFVLAALTVRFWGKRQSIQKIVPAMAAIFILSLTSNLFAKTIVVSPDGPITQIEQALESAQAEDTIIVKAGNYQGPWIINKSVKLEGENYPVVDGGGKGNVVQLSAPNISIRGFVIRNSGDILSAENTGLLVTAPNVLIEENRLENVLFGISLQRAPNATVRNNYLHSKNLPVARRGDLIRVWYSDHVTMEGNETVEGRDAVIWFSKQLILRGNTFRQGRYALHFMYCDDATVENNNFSDNSVGAYLMYSNRIRLNKNYIMNNRGPSGFGIGFKDMMEAEIKDNVVSNNKVGMFFDMASGNYEKNLIAYNDIGLKMLPSAQRNIFKENSFIENGEQVSLEGQGITRLNEWNGNYWSDYQGIDANRDGVGDMPYRSKRLFELLRERYPVLKIFLASPSTQALDFASYVFPVFAPQAKFQDNFPLMKPVFPPVQKGLPQASLPFIAVSGAFFLPLLGFVIGNRSRFGKHLTQTPGEISSVSAQNNFNSGNAVEVAGLTKNFGKVQALNHVSFEVKKGETIVLWGPNGAGKTTLLRCLLGIISFGGNISVLGRNVQAEGKTIRAQIGYMPQEIRLYNDQTVWETVLFFASLRRVGAERAKALLSEWKLDESLGKSVNNLSGGMKQKLALVIAMLSDPPIILLDEATSNLDVHSRREFIELLERLKKSGKTLILCSHRSGEVWKLADRVVVLEGGKKIIEGSPNQVTAHLGKEIVLWLTVPDDRREEAIQLMKKNDFNVERVNGNQLCIGTPFIRKAEPIRLLFTAGIPILDFEIESGHGENV